MAMAKTEDRRLFVRCARRCLGVRCQPTTSAAPGGSGPRHNYLKNKLLPHLALAVIISNLGLDPVVTAYGHQRLASQMIHQGRLDT